MSHEKDTKSMILKIPIEVNQALQKLNYERNAERLSRNEPKLTKMEEAVALLEIGLKSLTTN